MLLAAIADVLRWLQWAKTPDGRKNANQPEPIPRPGVQSRKRLVHPKVKGAPRSKIRKLLGREAKPDKAQRLLDLFSIPDGR